MTITSEQKWRIIEAVSVFETGRPQGDYAKVTILNDWQQPDGQRHPQITYGRMQTTESGKLKKLLSMYVEYKGLYAAGMAPYLPRLGQFPSLHQDQALLGLLREAGQNDPVMHATQDAFFEQEYWQPAHRWFAANGFATALSMLVVFDSFIHSGSIPSFLRKRFPAVPPAKGGSEQEWMRQYVEARHEWLLNHRDAILRKTIYRTRCLLDQMAADNWNLDKPVNANGVVV
jgi:chitosanase